MRTILILLAAAHLGCGPSRDDTLLNVKRHDDKLRTRAAFDMGCAADALVIHPIEQRSNLFHDDVKYTVVAGVSGCDKQATYIYDESRGVWVQNTETTSPTENNAAAK